MPMFTLGQLAQHLGCELIGNAGLKITGVSTIEKASSGEITFLANMRYVRAKRNPRALRL